MLIIDYHIYCTCSISEAICFRGGSVASVETILPHIVVCIAYARLPDNITCLLFVIRVYHL